MTSDGQRERVQALADALEFELHTAAPLEGIVAASQRAARKGSTKLNGRIEPQPPVPEGAGARLPFRVLDPVARNVLGGFLLHCEPGAGGFHVRLEMAGYAVRDTFLGPKLIVARPVRRFREILTAELQ